MALRLLAGGLFLLPSMASPGQVLAAEPAPAATTEAAQPPNPPGGIATPDGSGREAIASPTAPMPAEASGAGGPPTAAAAPAAAATPDWPSLGQLLALPDWLNLTLTLNAAPMANPVGGLSSAANWMQQNQLMLTAGTGLALDPSRWRGELDHWQLWSRLDLYNGKATYSSTIGSLFAPQTMAYSPGAYLSGLGVRRSSRDQAFSISGGYLSVDQDFLVAPPYESYLYAGFNDTLNLTLPGLPITPYAAPAVVLRWNTPGFGSWRIGNYWLIQETELAGLFGAPSALSRDLNGSMQVLQWDLPLSRPGAFDAPLALRGGGSAARQLPDPLLQLGALRTDVTFITPLDSPTGRNPLRNHVAYSSLTLPASLPLGLDNRFWGTLQWGLNPSQNVTPLFLAGGWQCQGPFPGRPLDVLSLGIGRTAFSPQLEPELNWAGAVELNYTIQINNRLSLQPVLQWILRPSGEGTVPAIVTTGLQLNLSL